MSEIKRLPASPFESIRRSNAHGDFWTARELQEILEYDTWRGFADSVERARLACENSGQDARDHFVPASKTIPLPKGAERDVLDFHLSRYACYLIAMNGDPRKNAIANAQTYFAAQTRFAEQAQELPAPAPVALPAAVGMEFLQQVIGNVVIAINEVKAEIRTEFTQALGDRPISGSQPLQIQKRIRTLAGLMGGTPAHYAEAWRRLKTRYGVAAYRDLTVAQFDDAVKFLDLQIASYRTSDLFDGGDSDD